MSISGLSVVRLIRYLEFNIFIFPTQALVVLPPMLLYCGITCATKCLYKLRKLGTICTQFIVGIMGDIKIIVGEWHIKT
jgi:hypothetical protein